MFLSAWLVLTIVFNLSIMLYSFLGDMIYVLSYIAARTTEVQGVRFDFIPVNAGGHTLGQNFMHVLNNKDAGMEPTPERPKQPKQRRKSTDGEQQRKTPKATTPKQGCMYSDNNMNFFMKNCIYSNTRNCIHIFVISHIVDWRTVNGQKIYVSPKHGAITGAEGAYRVAIREGYKTKKKTKAKTKAATQPSPAKKQTANKKRKQFI